jgi:regulator of protease activity HflC (stomatin/prohibitin superfamily)
MISFYFTLFLLFCGVILYNLILVVPMRQACVIERLGKFKGVYEAGLHFLIPFVDRVAHRHEIREQCLNILVAAVNLAQTTCRSEVGKMKLSETFSERDELNLTIVREIEHASEPWGIKVLRYEVMNITPSVNVIDTLEKQMEAERGKRAEITLANAERDSTINLSEGERQEAINLSEGARQRRINEAKGRAQEITIVAAASAEGMQMIASAINQPGGHQAMTLDLVGSYVDRMDDLFKEADISVVPRELARMEGFFEGMDQVSQTMKTGGK